MLLNKQFTMAEYRTDVHIPPPPALLDSVRLRDIHLHLPTAPDPWHRQGKPQPCIASMTLSYSSTVAAAAADDVTLSLDYGKLYRRLEEDVRTIGQQPELLSGQLTKDEMATHKLSQDVRVIGSVIANRGLDMLDGTAHGVRRMTSHEQTANIFTNPGCLTSYPITADYGECEVQIHLPKALLRAEGGLKYRSITIWGYKESGTEASMGAVAETDVNKRSVVLEEEFCIERIRCHCIVGVNSHERLEKQAVIVTLAFKGPGQLAWGSTVVDTYQRMTRTVAEVRNHAFLVSPSPYSLLISLFFFLPQRVEETSFQTVEALATFIARIATVDFANERVTVMVEKPSALAFVETSGVEITRTQSFFA